MVRILSINLKLIHTMITNILKYAGDRAITITIHAEKQTGLTAAEMIDRWGDSNISNGFAVEWTSTTAKICARQKNTLCTVLICNNELADDEIFASYSIEDIDLHLSMKQLRKPQVDQEES